MGSISHLNLQYMYTMLHTKYRSAQSMDCPVQTLIMKLVSINETKSRHALHKLGPLQLQEAFDDRK